MDPSSRGWNTADPKYVGNPMYPSSMGVPNNMANSGPRYPPVPGPYAQPYPQQPDYGSQLPPSSGAYGAQRNPAAGSAPPGAYPGVPGQAPAQYLQPDPRIAGSSSHQNFSFGNPWSMLTSMSQMGQNVQASQQYVSSRVSWFTGGFFQQLFQVDPKYDLYIPLFGMLTYVIMAASSKVAHGSFKPDSIYSMVSWASAAWIANFIFMSMIVRLMYLAAPPVSLEVLAYSGYCFIGFCLTTLCGWAFQSSLAWHIAWVYTSMCTSVFLIRTFKQIIRIDGASQPYRGDSGVPPKTAVTPS